MLVIHSLFSCREPVTPPHRIASRPSPNHSSNFSYRGAMAQGHRSRRRPSRTQPNGHGDQRRKLPASSPTRSPGPEQSKPSASPRPRVPGWMEPPPPGPATGDVSWLILDRFVHLSRRRRGVVQGDATASSLAEDCAGRHIRASLRIADTPAVSRLYLHWPGRPRIDGFADPAAIAAHRNSILFRMTVPFEDPSWWHATFSFPIDYLVYSCRSSSSSSSSPALPSLTALPPCFHGGATDPEFDKFFQPHRLQQQRIMFDEEMGILCHGDSGEFTVAHLAHRRRQLELCFLHHHHSPPSSSIPMKWSLSKLQIPPDTKINLFSWRTDLVVPIGRCLCWVDYYQGMLLVDVLADSDSPDQQQLHYVRLPAQALKSPRLYMDAGDPDPFRRVCVTDNGTIKLLCILVKRPPSPSDFTIITWTLVDINKGSWRKDADTLMGADEFFGLCKAAQSCLLPRVRPSFPVVSLVDPDVVCFLLKDEDCNLSWMVEVNMRNKVLQSSALYINQEEEGHLSEKECKRSFFGHYFIPTKFSSYLSKDAITSRKLSEMMQKAKEERATQKLKKCYTSYNDHHQMLSARQELKDGPTPNLMSSCCC